MNKKKDKQAKEIKIINKKKRNIFSLYKNKNNLRKKDIPPLIWPLQKDNFWISARFGMRKNKNKYEMHHGIDLAAAKGTPVKAVADGIVEKASYEPKGYGNMIIIKHNKNYKTRYAHMSKILVKKGDGITQGSIIGLVGSTGNTRGKWDSSHLHFEIIVDNKRENPIFYLM